nr:hypothetical protein [Tanacetum cinerariifolium]
MLAPGNYVQWKSRIKRYINSKPNHELIHYCLENTPYKLDWKDIEVPVSEGSPITTTARIHETYKNELIMISTQQLMLVRMRVRMWKVIERLKYGESINVQDLETNLYWEFGKFTSHDGESLESYYSRNGNVAEARENVDAADSRPIFDDEPPQQKSTNDDYNMLVIEGDDHPEQKSMHDTYSIEQDAQNDVIDSLDITYDRGEMVDQNDDDNDLAKEHMNYEREEIDQNDDDNDLAKERELLASL